jgi:hypothetical protein
MLGLINHIIHLFPCFCTAKIFTFGDANNPTSMSVIATAAQKRLLAATYFDQVSVVNLGRLKILPYNPFTDVTARGACGFNRRSASRVSTTTQLLFDRTGRTSTAKGWGGGKAKS